MARVSSKKVSFEEGLEKLENIVKELEGGDCSLENLLKKYSEGVLLSKACMEQLESTENAIDKLLKETKGKIQETVLDIGEE
ncbi:exodeoxyribonuclease VII small subunit [Anaerosinus massiliensis]|uniref:exodeoxyribonuclease VII small subunit n=1 Tax=Massilibacillus massiliensis TaxID=1806837 RepID=UPI000DA639F3|nr:exodeoxyribonuclease VII small subunit [Massilibacillus massiliensis]